MVLVNVSIAQPRTAPLQPHVSVPSPTEIQKFQSLSREQPLCNPYAIRLVRSKTWVFQSLSREQPLCNEEDATARSSWNRWFQSLSREQPLCNLVVLLGLLE